MEIPYVVTPRKDTGLFNSKIAIWLFLASEVMLFGGLFSGYIFLRLGASDPDWGYPWPERTLPVLPGLINTFILIASSVTVVFAWASLKMRKWGRYQLFMGMTVACAAIFMVFKAIEYNVKFHHQAARLKDYTMVEGHIDYEKKGDAHGHGGGHGDAEPDYVTDAAGDKIEWNHYKMATESLTFDLTRYHKAWVEDILSEAKMESDEAYEAALAGVEEAVAKGKFASLREGLVSALTGTPEETVREASMQSSTADQALKALLREQTRTRIRLAEDADFNRQDQQGEPVFEAGRELSLDLLAELRKAHLDHKAANAKWRVKLLRKAWDMKWDDVDDNDLLGEAAFTADFPKGTELEADERDSAYARWKAGKRASMATEVSIDAVKLTGGEEPVRIDGKSYADLEKKEIPTVTFKVDNPLSLRFRSHDVISAYDPEATQINLRDATVVGGRYEDSAMHFHYVDGVDFQHLAMDAERKGQDPLIAIENSWLIRENQEIAELWEKHRKAVGQLEEELALHGRVPTKKDRYRMGWQEIAYYMDTELENVAIEPGSYTPPRVKMHLAENFIGPDYGERHFPHIAIPREQVLLDSKFTPKWNTYYAIYFTITGLHGLHVVGGAIVLGYYLFFSRKMYLANPEWLANRVEVGGLFWHFVDLVWIFAFPIFYLM